MIRLTSMARLAAATSAAVALLAGVGMADPSSRPPADALDLRLIGMNDLHGSLEPPAGSSGRVVLPDGTTVDAGGAAFMATHVRNLEAEVEDSVVVGQGDLIGASPLASALFHDEPTIEVLNSIGMDVNAAGNHEFDEGYAELLRIQRGGCHPVDGCQYHDYGRARFPILGANVTLKRNGLPALPPVWLSFHNGVPVGYIGMPLEGTPEIVSAEGIRDLNFGDEVEAANRYADLLDRFGVRTIVLLVHQGDSTTGGGPDECRILPGGERHCRAGQPEDRRRALRAQPPAVQLRGDRPGRATTAVRARAFVRPDPVGGGPEDQPADQGRHPVRDQGHQPHRDQDGAG
jgi:5'-nucleotidase